MKSGEKWSTHTDSLQICHKLSVPFSTDDLAEDAAPVAATIHTLTTSQTSPSPYDKIHSTQNPDSNDGDKNDYSVPCRRRSRHRARMKKSRLGTNACWVPVIPCIRESAWNYKALLLKDSYSFTRNVLVTTRHPQPGRLRDECLRYQGSDAYDGKLKTSKQRTHVLLKIIKRGDASFTTRVF